MSGGAAEAHSPNVTRNEIRSGKARGPLGWRLETLLARRESDLCRRAERVSSS